MTLFCVMPAWPQTNSGILFSGEFYREGRDGRTVFLCVVRTLFSMCVLSTGGKGFKVILHWLGPGPALGLSFWPIGSLALDVLRFIWRMYYAYIWRMYYLICDGSAGTSKENVKPLRFQAPALIWWVWKNRKWYDAVGGWKRQWQGLRADEPWQHWGWKGEGIHLKQDSIILQSSAEAF